MLQSKTKALDVQGNISLVHRQTLSNPPGQQRILLGDGGDDVFDHPLTELKLVELVDC